MIKIFRKIRYDLMGKNKIGKYFIYAIGEIVLVVIGILIALQLNNKNEEQKTNAKIDIIFGNILEELALNIKETKNLMLFYHEKDSLAYLVLYGEFYNKKLTKEDILKPKIFNILWDLTTTYNQVFLSHREYDNLISNSDAIHSKYDEIFEDLYFLYVKYQKLVEVQNEEMRMNAIENYNERKNYDWFTSFGQNYGDDFSNYVLNDIRFKNKVMLTHINGIGKHLKYTIEYRNKAVDCYQKIAKILNKPIINNSFKIDSTRSKFWPGSWVSPGIPDEISTNYVKNGRMYSVSLQQKIPWERIFLSGNAYKGLSIDNRGVYITHEVIGEDKVNIYQNNLINTVFERYNDSNQ